MPPTTTTQQNAIDKVKITTDQLENPTPIPNLPTSSSFDFSQYLTPSPIQIQDLNTAEQARDTSLQDLTSAMFGNETQGARTLNYEEQAGIPILQRQLREVENQLTQTDLNFRREREKIQTETGLTVGQRNARLADVSRKQASQLADLEVIRAARSGVLSDAQSFVQRKTELEFADEQARIDRLKFIYENNEGKYKDELGKVVKKEERAFELAKEEYQTTENEKLQLVRNAQANGAGNGVLSAILKSKTVEEAYKNAGSFGMSIDDKIKSAQLDKIRAEIPKDIPEEEQEKAVVIADKIQNFDAIIGNKLGFKLAVGPTRLNRTPGALDITSGGIGAKQEFIASVEQLVSEETLNTLINAKAKGATFGALSEGELALLKQSASKIGKWSKTNKSGKVVGYEAPETAFLEELNTLKNLQIKAYEKATGIPYNAQPSFSVNPSTGNIIINAEQDDESFWSNG